jgi:hypothetical protein
LLGGAQDRKWPLTCGAKGTRTPGLLLDANHIFFVFLRRWTCQGGPFTCRDCRRLSAGIGLSRAPLARCLALLRHPSGSGGSDSRRSDFTPAALARLALVGVSLLAVPRNSRSKHQLTHLALGWFVTRAFWLAPPESIDPTGVPPSGLRCRIEPFIRSSGASDHISSSGTPWPATARSQLPRLRASSSRAAVSRPAFGMPSAIRLHES